VKGEGYLIKSKDRVESEMGLMNQLAWHLQQSWAEGYRHQALGFRQQAEDRAA